MILETYEDRGYTVEIHTDDDPPNPRTDCDNFGIMCCEHSRYNLGDKGGMRLLYDSLQEDSRMVEAAMRLPDDEREVVEDDDFAGMIKLARKWGYVVMPLYLYDHSGITMSTSAFSCPWDSGQVGVIFASPKMQNDAGLLVEQAAACLEGEVEIYDQYLRGDVYGYIVKDNDGEELDSCWGFYGDEYCREGAKEMVNYYVKRNGEQLDMLA